MGMSTGKVCISVLEVVIVICVFVLVVLLIMDDITKSVTDRFVLVYSKSSRHFHFKRVETSPDKIEAHRHEVEENLFGL